jgi:transcription-repair coupling factor (superfamily II helicase)
MACEAIQKEYERRQNVYREPFPKNNAAFAQFEKSFEYPLSDDVVKCVDAVERDMVYRTFPMFRTIFGNNGPMKLEVALRAAYRTVLAKKQ